MSHLATYIMHPEGNMDISSFMKFDDDMKNYDIPVTTAELMSSEFFDVVLSMEKETSNNLLNEDYLNPVHIEAFPDPTLPTPIDAIDNDSSAENEVVMFQPVNNKMKICNSPTKVLKEPTKRIIVNKPVVNKVMINKPAVNKPIISKPIVSKPIASKPIASKPIVSKPIVPKCILNTGGKKICKNKQPPIRVQPITANGRSLLLKQYKVLDAGSLTNSPSATYTALFKRAAMEKGSPSSSESVDEEIEVEYEVENGHSKNSRYPPLLLNSEEKRLLQKEGITLPSHYPLTKNEEKELKRIRRKIRNKISAQDSRKRKKEYVDKLEEKAKRTSDENEFLKRRIKVLRKQNSRLMEQMQKLQRLLFSTTSSKATPTTCLMIVLFSTLLVCLPNLNLLENKDMGEQQLFAARRALLYNKQSGEEDGLNMEEFVTFNKDEETELENIAEPESEVPMRQFSKMLSEISQIYSHPVEKNRSEGTGASEQLDRENDDDNMIDILGLVNECMEVDKKKKKFIEPDISDDEGPPINPRKRPYLDANVAVEEPPSKVIIHENIPIDFEYLNQLNTVHSPNISGEDELFTAIESTQFMAQE